MNSTSEESERIGEKLAPFNPSSPDIIKMALDMAKIQPQDIVYDLGCGDARFLVEACKINPQIKGIGVEYDKIIYEKAVSLVNDQKLQDQIKLYHENVLNIDFTEASLIFIYLVPEGIKRLKPQLVDSLNRGVRIITYVFSIPELTPIEVQLYKGATKVYLYTKDSI